MNKVFIFDLDDTLFHTSAQLDESYKNLVNIQLFPGVKDMLNKIKLAKHPCFLVTCGNREIQNKKIQILQLASYFQEIFIVDQQQDKKKIFELIIRKFPQVKKENILVIGDRLDSEITYANQLELFTVRVKQGKRASQTAQNTNEKPTLELTGILEVNQLIN